MKKIVLSTLLLNCLMACEPVKETKVAPVNEEPLAPTFGLVIHGGAGTILKKNMTPALEAAYKETLEKAIRAGHTILKEGGSSADAVEQAIWVMEDSPLFNAGKGAVFTSAGTNELDASFMDGKTKNAGAVAGITNVRHPISAARAVMEKSPHVMMACEGAELFAKEQGLEIVGPSYFFTEQRMKALKRAKELEVIELDHDEKSSFQDLFVKGEKFGTVGCVALDNHGNLAAGTSTGGMTNKRWGRVGDSPIIGAGTYANNATCAVSSTGWGEFFIRNVVAYDIAAMMEYKGISVQEASTEVIQKKLSGLGGDGGIIAIDNKGNIAMEFNTAGMYRASMNAKGELYVRIYKE